MSDREAQSQSPRKLPLTTRTRSGQSRIYQHLGVRDLREIIDQKRSERGYPNEVNVPPPDPSYNYLKDPLRDSGNQNAQESNQINSQKNKNKPSNKWNKEHYRGQPSNQEKLKDIENPVNIKVEFSTSSGEHTYKLDENTVLPTIKHVPDHVQQHKPFRGRGRGHGRRNYETRTIRNNKRSASSNTADSGRVSTTEKGSDRFDVTKVCHHDGLCVENIQEPEEFDYNDHGDESLNDDENYMKHGLENDIRNLRLNDECSPKTVCNDGKQAETS